MNKTIIVYGATGGTGSATARKLHAEGYRLHLVARSEDQLSALADELDAGYTHGDVTESDLFARVAEDAGAVDGLVYAIGTIKLRSLNRLSAEDFVEDFTVNAGAAALAVKAVLPALKKSKADPSIVFYSSVAARQGFSMHASIGMAKGAVSGLTVSLAAELAPGIRVNAIAPSLTQTSLASGILSNQKLAESIASAHPLRRLGEAEDIAAATVFLLSEKASWITGQIIGVDGGRSTLQIGT
ncbi:NAD(P)-dependent dehydrogenase, short-chain alcohol dehydrogenase family [Alkalispirochaeta americana]|uniref:NAD(P)-dependent dehydrogenase, short-chain alcohol dehydrogenase family n=1 Tax=Alkalispirochaeta americana TaxID=159291 RepID=A0A1N6SUX3_9SPIO|nr:SDR family oxidoreductase [Alkalispirochaeta americana]SIQ44841.1 NAD(P)-dependent dehydrogenase, short-chain alcohol dehydrogenase family [Alkalispirochaeta americana]